MRFPIWTKTTIVLVAMIGCGGSAIELNPKPSPVGGAMMRLPRGQGLVAIKTEAADAKSKSRNRPVCIVAYFYAMDGTTPLSPAPTDVVFKIGIDEKAKNIALSPDVKNPNRFVSAVGPYANGIQGVIQAKIQGEDVTESFSSM